MKERPASFRFNEETMRQLDALVEHFTALGWSAIGGTAIVNRSSVLRGLIQREWHEAVKEGTTQTRTTTKRRGKSKSRRSPVRGQAPEPTNNN